MTSEKAKESQAIRLDRATELLKTRLRELAAVQLAESVVRELADDVVKEYNRRVARSEADEDPTVKPRYITRKDVLRWYAEREGIELEVAEARWEELPCYVQQDLNQAGRAELRTLFNSGINISGSTELEQAHDDGHCYCRGVKHVFGSRYCSGKKRTLKELRG
jgi:hypothetical protein